MHTLIFNRCFKLTRKVYCEIRCQNNSPFSCCALTVVVRSLFPRHELSERQRPQSRPYLAGGYTACFAQTNLRTNFENLLFSSFFRLCAMIVTKIWNRVKRYSVCLGCCCNRLQHTPYAFQLQILHEQHSHYSEITSSEIRFVPGQTSKLPLDPIPQNSVVKQTGADLWRFSRFRRAIEN